MLILQKPIVGARTQLGLDCPKMTDEKIRSAHRIKPPVVVGPVDLFKQQRDTGHIESQAGFPNEIRPSSSCLERPESPKNKAKFSGEYLLVTGEIGLRRPEQGGGKQGLEKG